MRRFLIPVLIPVLSLATLAGAANQVWAQSNTQKTVECYCTNREGARVELGQRICLVVDGRMFMAECQMSLNVPMWRELGEGCLTSALPQMSFMDQG
ncbi:hypothetical protein [Thalassovita mediterranea]|jgi:hypothetical protein|uniref:Integral membrane protein n=1 Tax=Thalassovita mediterranea TaxID=340021 RepID=A0A0P1GLK2_9RHOB|nr:hypothetical protein [Thalassovita mediterranea]CUH83239.1 hypothetical protein TM5383_00424 [Thalassovita mediterranea]SIS33586.1 hypothetical protein SAMN05421685_108153 [Thalassovita mediterranea]